MTWWRMRRPDRRSESPEEKLLAKREANRQASRRSYEKARRNQRLSNASGLTDRQVQQLWDWYSEQAFWHFSPKALAAGLLDEALRRRLAEEGVPPGRIELEFQRVLKAR